MVSIKDTYCYTCLMNEYTDFTPSKELKSVIEREQELTDNDAKEYGVRIAYYNSSCLCASEKQCLNSSFVTQYVYYYQNVYPQEKFISNIPREYLLKHANGQAVGILNWRIRHFIEKLPLPKTEIENREYLARTLFEDEALKNKIGMIRRSLGLSSKANEIHCHNIDDAMELTVGQAIDNDQNMEALDDEKAPLYGHYREGIVVRALGILDELSLEDGWIDYLVTLIASPDVMPDPKTYLNFPVRRSYLTLRSITDSTMLIQLQCGMGKQEFEAVYKAISPILKLEPYEAPYIELHKKETRIYQDYKSGMSEKQLAKKYLHCSDDSEDNSEDDSCDLTTGRNTISHIISRFEKKYGRK